MHSPQIILPPPGKAKPRTKQAGPTSALPGSFLQVSCLEHLPSGYGVRSSAPNTGLFELGQLLAGTNSCPLARDNLINSSRFIHVHTSPTTSSKPDLAISPGYNRAPLVSAAPCFFCLLCSRFILYLRCSAGWFCSGVGEIRGTTLTW